MIDWLDNTNAIKRCKICDNQIAPRLDGTYHCSNCLASYEKEEFTLTEIPHEHVDSIELLQSIIDEKNKIIIELKEEKVYVVEYRTWSGTDFKKIFRYKDQADEYAKDMERNKKNSDGYMEYYVIQYDVE